MFRGPAHQKWRCAQHFFSVMSYVRRGSVPPRSPHTGPVLPPLLSLPQSDTPTHSNMLGRKATARCHRWMHAWPWQRYSPSPCLTVPTTRRSVAHAPAPTFKERWLRRLDETLVQHPFLSTGVFVASDAVIIFGGSALLQLAGVPLSPEWVAAAALSEALRLPVQALSLVVLTPLMARLFPSLQRIRTGAVARQAYRSLTRQPAPLADMPPTPIEVLANKYGAAALVSKSVISLTLRLVLFGAIHYGVDLAFLQPLMSSVVAKQVSYLTLSASLAVFVLPLRLMSPAIVVPHLIKAQQAMARLVGRAK